MAEHNPYANVDIRVEYRCGNCDEIHEAVFEGDPGSGFHFLITLAANDMPDFTVFVKDDANPDGWRNDTESAIDGLANVASGIFDTLEARDRLDNEWTIS